MKKILGLCFVVGFGLSGCTVDQMAKAQTSVSSFDGAKSIRSNPMYVYATTGKHSASFLVGGNWVQQLKDNIAVKVVVNYEYTSISSLELSFDGEIKGYQPLSYTDLSLPNNETFAARSSSQFFIVPTKDIERLKNSQNVKIRIGTRRGELVGDLVKKHEISPGGKSLINVVNDIPK